MAAVPKVEVAALKSRIADRFGAQSYEANRLDRLLSIVFRQVEELPVSELGTRIRAISKGRVDSVPEANAAALVRWLVISEDMEQLAGVVRGLPASPVVFRASREMGESAGALRQAAATSLLDRRQLISLDALPALVRTISADKARAEVGATATGSALRMMAPGGERTVLTSIDLVFLDALATEGRVPGNPLDAAGRSEMDTVVTWLTHDVSTLGPSSYKPAPLAELLTDVARSPKPAVCATYPLLREATVRARIDLFDTPDGVDALERALLQMSTSEATRAGEANDALEALRSVREALVRGPEQKSILLQQSVDDAGHRLIELELESLQVESPLRKVLEGAAGSGPTRVDVLEAQLVEWCLEDKSRKSNGAFTRHIPLKSFVMAVNAGTDVGSAVLFRPTKGTVCVRDLFESVVIDSSQPKKGDLVLVRQALEIAEQDVLRPLGLPERDALCARSKEAQPADPYERASRIDSLLGIGSASPLTPKGRRAWVLSKCDFALPEGDGINVSELRTRTHELRRLGLTEAHVAKGLDELVRLPQPVTGARSRTVDPVRCLSSGFYSKVASKRELRLTATLAETVQAMALALEDTPALTMLEAAHRGHNMLGLALHAATVGVNGSAPARAQTNNFLRLAVAPGPEWATMTYDVETLADAMVLSGIAKDQYKTAFARAVCTDYERATGVTGVWDRAESLVQEGNALRAKEAGARRSKQLRSIGFEASVAADGLDGRARGQVLTGPA